jgi:membrane associated rhomboid family serine protease
MMTLIIVVVTLVVSFYAWSNEKVMYKLIMDAYSVTKYKQYYRLLTSGFIHADYMHLGFNMLALYGFGQMVEYYFVTKYGMLGEILYLLFYVLAIIVADVPSYIKNKNNYRYSSLGASGGTSALVMASVLFSPLSKVSFFFIPMPAIMMGVLFLGYSYFMSTKKYDNINHDAHIHGAIFGLVAAIVFFPESMINFYYTLSSLF